MTATPTAYVSIHIPLFGITYQDAADKYASDYGEPRRGIENLRDLLAKCQMGAVDSNVLSFVASGSPTAAAGTAAFVQINVAAEDTVTVCGVVFTAKAAPSTRAQDAQFANITSDTAVAASFAAAVNAHPKLKQFLLATAAVGTVTLTMLQGGIFGNNMLLAKSSVGVTVTQPASATPGTAGTARGHIVCFKKSL